MTTEDGRDDPPTAAAPEPPRDNVTRDADTAETETLETGPLSEPLLMWRAQTRDGAVYKVTLDQLNAAFQAGRVDETLRIRPPAAGEWTTLGDLLAKTAPPPPEPAPSVEPILTAPPAELPPSLAGAETPAARRVRPVLGPALVVFSVMLWAFIVVGTFTTSWISGGYAPLSEGAARFVVMVAIASTWVVTVRRSRAVPPRGRLGMPGRFVGVGIAAFAFFVSVVVVASVLGKVASTNLDVVIAGALLVLAGLAARAGNRMLAPTLLPKGGSRRAVVLAWIAITVVTLGSCVELAAER